MFLVLRCLRNRLSCGLWDRIYIEEDFGDEAKITFLDRWFYIVIYSGSELHLTIRVSSKELLLYWAIKKFLTNYYNFNVRLFS